MIASEFAVSWDAVADDEAFLARFERQAVPSAEWHHREHIRVAYLYIRRYGLEAALPRLREGIQALNKVNGIVDTLTYGYHETITAAWLRIVDSTIRRQGPGEHSLDFLEKQPHLTQKTLLRLFYTRDRLISVEAKARFVEPDVTALPS